MTVDEASAMARDLAREMEKLLVEFEEKTNCRVCDLQENRYTVGGKVTVSFSIVLTKVGR